MAEEFKVVIGSELENTSFENVKNQINNIQVNPIALRLNTSNIENQINLIRQQIQNLGNININLGGNGNGNGGATRQINSVTEAYRQLMYLQRQIGSMNKELIGLDNTKDANKIKEITTEINRLSSSYNNLRAVFNQQLSISQLNNLERLLRTNESKGTIKLAGIIDTEEVKRVELAYKELYNVAKQIDNLELKIGSLGGISGNENTGEISVLTSQLNNLRQSYQQMSSGLQGKLSTEQLQNLSAMASDTKDKIAQLEAKVRDARNKLAQKITIDFNNSKLASDASQVEASFSKIKSKTIEVSKAMNEYKLASAEMRVAIQSGDADRIIASQQRYENALKNVKNQIDINIRAEQQNINAMKLASNKSAFSSEIDVWLKRNSAAAKQFGGQIATLKSQIQSCDDVRLNGLKADFKEIKRQAELAGKNTMSWSDRLKNQFGKYSVYLSAATMIYRAVAALRDMYNNVVEVDKAMTNLYKVTDETADRYDEFLNSSSKKAQELGRSMSSYIEQTANWAKMDFSIDESEELAKLSSIYANVAEVDDATAVSDMVTAMKAFNIEASDAITILDPMNKLGNEFAVTAAGLGQGLSRSASTMAVAGTDLNETLAILTGISEITQSPEEAGNFLKTSVARIQGMKGTLEELGEEVDESVDSISKVQTQILNLTNGEVNIFDDNGEFRDYYDIMKDIAEVVDDLTSTDRANLYEILFGKNRRNQGAAMLQAFQSGQIEKAYQAAQNSSGSAFAEQEKWAESLESKIGTLKAAWEGFSQTFLGSDFLSGLIETGTKFVNILDGIIDKAGVLPTLFVGITTAMSFKNVGELIKQFHYPITLGNEYAHKIFN